jgi:ABC-2 type transport system permease protein
MHATLAIAAREFWAFFRLATGWVVIALYLLLAGLIVGLGVLSPGQPASLAPLFAVSGWLLLPVAPAVSMRLVSDELRTGTIEPLLTAPVTDWQVALGKYAAAAAFLLTLLAPTLIHVALLYAVADPAPDPGPLLAGYLSVILTGLFYLAVGLFFSTLTASQTLAFLGTLFFLLGPLLAPAAAGHAPEWLARALFAVSIGPRLADLARGVIDPAHAVFFLSGSALFLVLAALSLESRRWR